jgi:hypothetical protein
MHTPGLACRVSTRGASHSLRGRLTDDIRLPRTTKNGKRRSHRDASCGDLAGICARVADGTLHHSVAAGSCARRTSSLESCPRRTSQDAARRLAAPVLSVQPERGTGRSDVIFGLREAGTVIRKLMGGDSGDIGNGAAAYTTTHH